MCGYEWGADDNWEDEHCPDGHVCILVNGHDGEHECGCGETQPEELL